MSRRVLVVLSLTGYSCAWAATELLTNRGFEMSSGGGGAVFAPGLGPSAATDWTMFTNGSFASGNLSSSLTTLADGFDPPVDGSCHLDPG